MNKLTDVSHSFPKRLHEGTVDIGLMGCFITLTKKQILTYIIKVSDQILYS